MGMFSTLNYLIDAPLEEIAGTDLPIRGRDQGGIAASHRAAAAMLYDLALSYERADWNAIDVPGGRAGHSRQYLDDPVFQLHGECQRDMAAAEQSHPQPDHQWGTCGYRPAPRRAAWHRRRQPNRSGRDPKRHRRRIVTKGKKNRKMPLARWKTAAGGIFSIPIGQM